MCHTITIKIQMFTVRFSLESFEYFQDIQMFLKPFIEACDSEQFDVEIIILKNSIKILNRGEIQIEYRYDRESLYWMINVILEKIFIEIFQTESFLLHGGTVIFNNSAYIFMAERMSGKTTLITNLIEKDRGIKYLSDDIVAISKTKINGLPTPIMSRNKISATSLKNIKFFGCTTDEDGVKRNILSPFNSACEFLSIRAKLIIPSYAPDNTNETTCITGTEKFVRVLSNIKVKPSFQQMLLLKKFCENSECYIVKYNSSENAIKAINDINRV